MPDAAHEPSPERKERAPDWARAGRIAARKDGLLTARDLAGAAFRPGAITRAVGAGKLHRALRGVYVLGSPRLTRRQELRAALLHAGDAAGLSDETALEHRRLGPHVRELERLAEAAGARAGAPRVRRVLGQRTPGRGRTRSDLEIAFAVFVDRHRLAPPERSVLVRLGDGEVVELDAVWWDARIAVELDGGATHGTALAFHADRRRDRRVAVETGLRTIRVTWIDVEDRADELAADLRALLREVA